MSNFKGKERIKNKDGSELKVQWYDDKIVVHEKDSKGNYEGHTTDWFDNSGVHRHNKDGKDKWEGGNKKK